MLSHVFATELTKIIANAPFFLERCVSTMLAIASELLSRQTTNPNYVISKSSNKLGLYRSNDDYINIWVTLKLLLNIPPHVMEELGSRLAAGLLTLRR